MGAEEIEERVEPKRQWPRATALKAALKRENHKFGLIELFVVALLGIILGAYGSDHSWARKDGDLRIVIPAQPPVELKSNPSAVLGVVFFENGKKRLTSQGQSSLLEWAKALRGCDHLRLSVRGSASSVPFIPASRGNNIQLANDRADVAVQALKRAGVQGVEVKHISTDRELLKARSFNDHPDVARSLALETVARRSDLFFEDFGNCSSSLSGSTQH